jgi:prevent-host-death family protein
MDAVRRKGAEEARNQLPDLLDAAENGEATVITRHGRPVAAIVPVNSLGAVPRQESLLSVAGTGRGLWGDDSAGEIRRLRDEWNR